MMRPNSGMRPPPHNEVSHARCAGARVMPAVFAEKEGEGLYRHYRVWLERLAPVLAADQYHEDAIGEDIVDAHMKRHLLGREVVVAVTGGRLDFGQWEHIFYGEFDG